MAARRRAAAAPPAAPVTEACCATGKRAVVVAAAAASATESCDATNKRAVVVGAGPSGALAAMLLARQGWRVDVFDQLAPVVGEDGQAQASIGPRSYNILLSERATAAIAAAGADLDGFDAPEVAYMLRHKLKGGPAAGRRSQLPGRLRLANRGTLAGALVQQCLAQHGDSVKFHFQQRLNAIDSVKGVAFFSPVAEAAQGAPMASGTAGGGPGCGCDPGGEPGGGEAARGAAQAMPPEALTQQRTPASADGLASYAFDLLVGADGAGSLTRAVLQRHDAALAVRLTRDSMEFRVCVLGAANEFLPAGAPAAGTFQTWSNSKLQASLIGSSTRDGLLRCVLILPEGVHATLKTPADFEAYLAQAFPSLPQDAIKRAAPQLVESPISNGGTIVRCSKLNSGNTVLIGDAAHAVWPALGQGANAALEGTATFAAVMQELGSAGMEAAAAEYSRRWLPSALAVADLTEEGFGKNARAFAPNLKLVQLICQALLHKLLPFAVPQPAFFQLNCSSLSYAEILARSQREAAAFKAALVAAAALALAWFGRNLARPALTALGWA